MLLPTRPVSAGVMTNNGLLARAEGDDAKASAAAGAWPDVDGRQATAAGRSGAMAMCGGGAGDCV